MPLYTYTCLAWQHLMALGLTCSGTKKGRERKGRDRKTSICPNTVSQSTWTGPNPGNVMKPVFFVFSPHCPPISLAASVLCPSSFFFLSPALHQEYQCYKEWFPYYYWSLLLGWHSAWHPCSWDTHTLSLSLMMDQKASLLISGIGRREGAGHMLEPSVLHLWNADDHKLWEKQTVATRPLSTGATCQTQCITGLLDIQEHAK